MAINYPNSPTVGETFEDGGVTWIWDGVAWNVQASAAQSGNSFTTIVADTGSTIANTVSDTLTITGESGVSTSITGDTLTITGGGGGGGSGAITNVVTDDGTFSAVANLNILGGTNIATEAPTDSNNVVINLSAFSVDFLSDVDTTTNPPSTGQVLKWDGAKWAPAVDATTGGAGTDADTLDGQDGSYYLNYNNFTNTPSVLTLASLSVGNNNTASGSGTITYDNSTGVFRFTPPDLSGFSTFSGAYADLTGKPTIPDDLTDLGISDGTNGHVLTTDGAGNFTFQAAPGAGGGIALTDLSVAAEPAASGDGSLAYDNGTGIFTYTPPVIPAALTDLGISDGQNGQFLRTDGAGNFTFNAVPAPSLNFDGLGDAPSGYNIAEVVEAAIVTLRVGNVSTSAYTFDSHYSGNNPTIYAISGTTIAFDLSNISGHPFEIQDSTGTAYSQNLVHVDSDGTVSTGASANGKSSGVLYWRIPVTTTSPPNYRYQCTSHSSMVGPITIKNITTI